MPLPVRRAAVLILVAAAAMPAALAQHAHDGHVEAPAGGADARTLVKFPDGMRAHTLSNMREHLQALGEILAALAAKDYDAAGRIAEQRLGMTSLTAHGAHEASKFMPQGMRDFGTAMHRGASRFALELQKTAVTHDPAPALGLLAETTRACAGCHAGYRLQ